MADLKSFIRGLWTLVKIPFILIVMLGEFVAYGGNGNGDDNGEEG